jgi:hypothetical protein
MATFRLLELSVAKTQQPHVQLVLVIWPVSTNNWPYSTNQILHLTL